METSHALLLSLAVIIIGVLLFYIAMRSAELFFKKKVTSKTLFKDFHQKMWMTIGLGLIFIIIYLLLAYLSTFLNDREKRLNWFFMVYQHPVIFVYLGLFTFAFFTTVIYLARLLIKYIYNAKKYKK